VAIERQHARPLSRRLGIGGLSSGGTRGNELLTALTGGVLIVLLAVIGVTIISLTRLLWVHLFVGMLLIGPVVLKLSSTGYRFVRYYTSNPRYRRKGPPPLPLRLIAPVVVLTTLIVFASGVGLLFIGPSSRDTLLPIHKVSFFVWLVFTAVHVLAHLPTLAHALRSDYLVSTTRTSATAGRAGRALSLTGALAGGVVVAVVVIHQFAPWISAQHLHH
jgi:hypothetical protein